MTEFPRAITHHHLAAGSYGTRLYCPHPCGPAKLDYTQRNPTWRQNITNLPATNLHAPLRHNHTLLAGPSPCGVTEPNNDRAKTGPCGMTYLSVTLRRDKTVPTWRQYVSVLNYPTPLLAAAPDRTDKTCLAEPWRHDFTQQTYPRPCGCPHQINPRPSLSLPLRLALSQLRAPLRLNRAGHF